MKLWDRMKLLRKCTNGCFVLMLVNLGVAVLEHSPGNLGVAVLAMLAYSIGDYRLARTMR